MNLALHKLIKIILLLCTLLITLFNLTGCYDARGVEDLAYATAIGLDISDDNNLSLTLQFSIPNSSSESGSSQSNKTDVVTVLASSISSGLSLLNSYVSKEINLSHCKVIILSEEFCKNHISQYLDTLSNYIELRPDCKVIISKCSAEDFIKNSSPSIETLTARYYEIALKSNEYTGYTTATKFSDFVGNTKDTFIQNSAILGSLTSKNSESTIKQDNSYIASETPIQNSESVETFGTAVFYNDQLVGELNGAETICHLIVSNKLKNCTLTIPNPLTSNSNIDLYVSCDKTPEINVEIINGTPFITISVFLKAYGLSLDDFTNYSSAENIDIINKKASSYLQNSITSYLYKTSKELNSDIDGYSKKALSKYTTSEEWNNYNWLSNYKNAFFNVNVNISTTSGYNFNKSP